MEKWQLRNRKRSELLFKRLVEREEVKVGNTYKFTSAKGKEAVVKAIELGRVTDDGEQEVVMQKVNTTTCQTGGSKFSGRSTRLGDEFEKCSPESDEEGGEEGEQGEEGGANTGDKLNDLHYKIKAALNKLSDKAENHVGTWAEISKLMADLSRKSQTAAKVANKTRSKQELDEKIREQRK